MRRLLMSAAIAAQPAADPLSFVAAARRWEVPAAHGRCDLWQGGVRHDVRAWVDGDRFHLAWMGPFGAPKAVLRGDGDRLHLTVGTNVIVAEQAGAVLAEAGIPDLRDGVGLLVGRLPAGRVRGVRALGPGRWVVDLGAGERRSLALLEGDRVVALDWTGGSGALQGSLGRTGDGLPSYLSLEPLGIEARCAWTEEGVVPAAAFTMDGTDAVPVESLGRRLALELAMLAARRD